MKRAFFICTSLVIGLLLAISSLGTFFNRLVYDNLMIFSHPRPMEHRIIIVAIDEPSFSSIKQQWPWARSIHARLLEALQRSGADTIGFDILFAEPSQDPGADTLLAQSFKAHGNVVLAAGLETSASHTHTTLMQIRPLPILEQAARMTGLDTMPLDSDGFLRQCFLKHNGLINFGIAAARAHRPLSPESAERSGKKNGPCLVNFYGPPGTFPTVSYYQALDPEQYLPEGFFKGALVLVGLNLRSSADPSSGKADHYATPHVRAGFPYMSGVEIQANIISNILSGKFIRKAPVLGQAAAALMVWGLAVLLFFSPVKRMIFLPVLIVSGYSLTAIWLFQQHGIILYPAIILVPAGVMALSSIGWMACQAIAEKTMTKAVFSKYLSPGFVDYMLDPPCKNDLILPAEGTVLFLDLKDFSKLSQTVPHEQLIQILSRYLGGFSDIIIENHGHIDKIVGDGIMAVWGMPTPSDRHARDACRAALAILDHLHQLQAEDTRDKKNPLDIRIGINSGVITAGNISGKSFSDFTVHGMEVNLAKRLEPLNKIYQTRILISEHTRERIKEWFGSRQVDTVRVKGYDGPVTIYELMPPGTPGLIANR